jgi:ABC-type transport system substrate-binding protein
MKRRSLFVLRLLFVLLVSLPLAAQSELRFCIASDPKTFNPLLVEDDSTETIQYLTGGVLIRVNRLTQNAEPELATSWKVTGGGKTITFKLRDGIHFSDGTPFSPEDVAYTVQQLMDPSLHSPTGDSFRSGEGKVVTSVLKPNRVTITFPAPIAGLDKLFDRVAIMSAKSPKKEMAVLGPYYVAEPGRISSAIEAQSQLLEAGRCRQAATLYRFHTTLHPTKSRYRNAASAAWRDPLHQFSGS